MSNKIANQLSALFVAVLCTVLITVGFAPNTAQSGPRWAGSSGGGGGVVPVATCSTSGGVLYSSGGAITCNPNLTTDGVGVVSASAAVKAGTNLSYTDTGIVLQGVGSQGAYVQAVLQNTAASSGSSVDYIVSNNLGTAGTFYGDFGMNSSTFSGAFGSLSKANSVYLYSQNGDLSLGTQSVNSIHFETGGATTDAATVTNNLFTFNGKTSIGGLVITPSGATDSNIQSGSGNIGTFTWLNNAGATAWTVGSAGLTPSQTLGIVGTNTNNNANAGSFGEYVTSSVASSGAVVTVSSNTPVTVVSTGATVTAGDWEVEGLTCYISAAATSFTVYKQGISTTTNTFGALGTYTTEQFAAMIPLATTTSENCRVTPTTRISLSGTSNVFMVAAPIFTVSGTITAYGFMRLRRAR